MFHIRWCPKNWSMNADKPQTSKLVPLFPVAHIRVDFLCGQYETEDTKIVQLHKYFFVSMLTSIMAGFIIKWKWTGTSLLKFVWWPIFILKHILFLIIKQYKDLYSDLHMSFSTARFKIKKLTRLSNFSGFLDTKNTVARNCHICHEWKHMNRKSFRYEYQT